MKTDKPKARYEDDYGKPRKGINPLTGKPRGPSRMKLVIHKDFFGVAIISPSEEHSTPEQK